MVVLRRIAEFKADFPDDQVWDGDEAVILGGRAVAEAIAAMLNRNGFAAAQPEHTPPYGWRFMARAERTPIRIQVTDLDDILILDTKDASGFFARLGGASKQAHADLLRALHEELGRDKRFSDIKWFERYEAGERPAQRPVD